MFGLLALVTAATFFGAAFYVSFAEQPARLGLDDRAAAWWTTGVTTWVLGAIFIIANWPYTLIVIMPVNHRLEASLSTGASSDTRLLLTRWGRLHAGRSVLGAVATSLYLIAALKVGHSTC